MECHAGYRKIKRRGEGAINAGGLKWTQCPFGEAIRTASAARDDVAEEGAARKAPLAVSGRPSHRAPERSSQTSLPCSQAANYFALTASLNALPAVNFTVLAAAICSVSPVFGLRPSRAAR